MHRQKLSPEAFCTHHQAAASPQYAQWCTGRFAPQLRRTITGGIRWGHKSSRVGTNGSQEQSQHFATELNKCTRSMSHTRGDLQRQNLLVFVMGLYRHLFRFRDARARYVGGSWRPHARSQIRETESRARFLWESRCLLPLLLLQGLGAGGLVKSRC